MRKLIRYSNNSILQRVATVAATLTLSLGIHQAQAQRLTGVSAPHDQPAPARLERLVERADRRAVVRGAARRAAQPRRGDRVDDVDRDHLAVAGRGGEPGVIAQAKVPRERENRPGHDPGGVHCGGD